MFTSSIPKITTISFHDFQIDFLENNEVVYRARGYFGAKSKRHDTTTKKLVKEHPLRIRDIF